MANRLKVADTQHPFTKPKPKAKPKSKPRSKAKGLGHQDRIAVVVATIAALTTVVFSMVLNVRAFTETVSDPLAMAAGIAIPLWVLALTYLGQHLHERARHAAIAAYILAAFALIVSLPHLVHGYEAWGLAGYEAWSLALVTDLTQVVMKVGIITLVRK